MIIKKLKVWKGWQIWEIIDSDKKEIFTKMKWYGRNFKTKKRENAIHNP